MNECSGFSFFDILALSVYRKKYTEGEKGNGGSLNSAGGCKSFGFSALGDSVARLLTQGWG